MRLSSLVIVGLIAVSLFDIHSRVEAQETTTETDWTPPTAQELQAEWDRFMEEADQSAESIDAIKDVMSQSRRDLARLDELRKATERFRRQIQGASEKLTMAAANLQEWNRPPDTSPSLPDGVTMADLEQEVAERETELSQASERLAQLQLEPSRRAKRMLEIPNEITAADNELQTLKTELDGFSQNQGLGGQERVRQLAARVRAAFLRQTVEMLKSESEFYGATTQLLRTERDAAIAKHAFLNAQTSAWRDLVVLRKQTEAQQQAQEARMTALLASPDLSELAERVSSLAQIRATLTDRIARETQHKTQRQEQLRQLKENFEEVRERVAAIGLSDASGQILRRDRSRIPTVRPLRRSIGDRRLQIEEATYEEYRYDDLRREMVNLDRLVQSWAIKISPPPDDDKRQELRALLESQRDSLDAVIHETRDYKSLLLDLDLIEQQIIDLAQEFRGFVDERVLWVRSTHAVNSQSLVQARDAFRWLMAAENWRAAGKALLTDARENVGLVGLLVLVILLLVYCQKPSRVALGHIGTVVERSGSIDFTPTLRALSLTATISAIWPFILFIVASRWSESRTGTEFTPALAQGLLRTAVAWLPLEFIRQTCRPGGLADSHFKWPKPVLGVVRRNLRWINLVGLPLLFVCLMFDTVTSKPWWSDSLGRFAFLGLLLLSAIFLYQLLLSRHGVVHQVVAFRPSSLAFRSRYLWIGAILLMPVALMVLASGGYYETARKLAVHLYISVCTIVLLMVANSCCAHWALLRRRRLAMEQMRQRHTANQPEDHPPGEAVISAGSKPASDDVDLSVVAKQTRQLIGIAFLISGATILWFVWKDLMPALGILDRYPLWPQATLTVADLLKAALAAFVTFVGTRNVAGLLELTLLNYLPVDRGARYATISLCRYAVLALGLTTTVRFLGIEWSSVQWLVAAMGIGLGFGLQEIFANFVSGVLLLFERPIRVGDIVTLGDTSGVVTNMRIRATTITDWDRREYIVPNKDLVTGRLLNWTLSDTTNRIVIQVGIAYGSDVAKAREILLKIATEHDAVLSDPAASVAFEGFGDSALNMTLRCYLPSLERRLSTIHELHDSIHDQFKAAGIEIPFPQRDVNIKPSVVAPDMMDLPVRHGAEVTSAGGSDNGS